MTRSVTMRRSDSAGQASVTGGAGTGVRSATTRTSEMSRPGAMYGSLSDMAVSKGARVTKGQVIGTIGATDPSLPQSPTPITNRPGAKRCRYAARRSVSATGTDSSAK